MEPHVESLVSALEGFTPVRTGELDVRVVVTNLGNTDGLLGPTAELQFEESDLVVELTSLQALGSPTCGVDAIDGSLPPSGVALLRKGGKPCFSFTVTCTGCRDARGARARCETPARAPAGFRPAPGRAPPRERKGSSYCLSLPCLLDMV